MKRTHTAAVIVGLAAVVTVISCCLTRHRNPEVLDSSRDSQNLLDPAHRESWQAREIGSKAPVRYTCLEEGGVKFIRADSHDAASMLVRHSSFDPRHLPILSWTWRVLKCPDGEDLRRKSGNDCAARILVGFKGDWSKAGILEKSAAQQEVRKTGYEPPGFLLVYVWSREKIEGPIDDPHVGERAKIFVVSGPDTSLGMWQTVRRNLVDDFRAAFGFEPPDVVSVAIMTDTDDTRSSAQADYGAILAETK